MSRHARIVTSHVCPPIPYRGRADAIADLAHELTGASMSLEDARAVFADMPRHDEATIDAAADALLALGEPEEIDAAAEWLSGRAV